jgi:rRNA maturation endonuclease Nob1
MKYKCLNCGNEFDAMYEAKCKKCGAKDWDVEPLRKWISHNGSKE